MTAHSFAQIPLFVRASVPQFPWSYALEGITSQLYYASCNRAYTLR